MGLAGVVGVIAALIQRFGADNADFMVMLASGFGDPPILVKLVNDQHGVGFNNAGFFCQTFEHKIQHLEGFHHGCVELFLADQSLNPHNAPADLFPAVQVVCVSHTCPPLQLKFIHLRVLY